MEEDDASTASADLTAVARCLWQPKKSLHLGPGCMNCDVAQWLLWRAEESLSESANKERNLFHLATAK